MTSASRTCSEAASLAVCMLVMFATWPVPWSTKPGEGCRQLCLVRDGGAIGPWANDLRRRPAGAFTPRHATGRHNPRRPMLPTAISAGFLNGGGQGIRRPPPSNPREFRDHHAAKCGRPRQATQPGATKNRPRRHRQAPPGAPPMAPFAMTRTGADTRGAFRKLSPRFGREHVSSHSSESKPSARRRLVGDNR